MKIYLAGPMAGMPEDNYPEFNKAAAWLRSKGHMVFNPAELEQTSYDIKNNDQLRKIMAKEFAFICLESECIALLPGWENSKGAFAEWALAVRVLSQSSMVLNKKDYDPDA